jgi:hypothetical protein
MIHIGAKFNQTSIQQKNSLNANSSSAGLSDNQIMGLDTPKTINPILWKLSNAQERRALMDNSTIQQNGNSTLSETTANSSSSLDTLTVLPKIQQKAVNNGELPQASNQTDTELTQSLLNGLGNTAQASSTSQSQEQQALKQVTQQFQQRFRDSAENSASFHSLMKKSFGDQYNADKAETIRQQTLKGDFSWMPDIKLLNESQLQDQSGTQAGGKAQGAYSQSNDTIYLSKELLKTDMGQAEKVLSEEVGHAIDARVNVNDAKGDEGDIFSRQLHGESLSTEKLNELRQENDSGVINVDGKTVEVEYSFFSKLGKKIKKGFNKVKNKVKKAFNKVKNKVKKTFKKIGNAIKKGVKAIGKGLKKIVQSKIFRAILTVAQFIPIPVVALVAKGINLAVSAYNVYQGVKHKSWGAVLGGVAGIAGGVGNLGKALGASASFVDKAASISKGLGTASMAYKAIAEKDFSAAAGLASNYFGGDSKITSTIQQVEKAHQTYTAVKNGDYLGAIGVGSTLMQDFTGSGGDKILKTIGENATAMNTIGQAVKDGDYGSAISTLTEQYGSNLNLSSGDKKKIGQVTEAFQQVQKANELIKKHNYADAAQLLLSTAEEHANSPEAKQQLVDASQKVKQFDDVVTAVKDGHYSEGITKAAELMNTPIDDNSRQVLTEIQTYAENAQQLGELVKNGAPKAIIDLIKERMNEQVIIKDILKAAA